MQISPATLNEKTTTPNFATNCAQGHYSSFPKIGGLHIIVVHCFSISLNIKVQGFDAWFLVLRIPNESKINANTKLSTVHGTFGGQSGKITFNVA